MAELNPGSEIKLLTASTPEAAPNTRIDDLLEVDSYTQNGTLVRLVLNTEVNRVYVEVNDTSTEQLYAIPIPPGQKSKKIFNDPITYLKLVKISAEAESASEGKIYIGRDDEALLEEVEMPTSPKMLKHRSVDGIDVMLFHDEPTGLRTVSVMDTKTGEYFALYPKSRAEALDMYNHPMGRNVTSIFGFEKIETDEE